MAGSVTIWVEQLKEGEQIALQKVWERYFQKLIGLARYRLNASPKAIADEEDVVCSAFNSFWFGLENGHFPKLQDRDDLWQVLMLLTARKATNFLKFEKRQKRGGGNVLSESALSPDEVGPFFESVISSEPDPAFVTQMIEDYDALLNSLKVDQLQNVAIWKMEGLTNKEIAGKLGCVESTVERRLRSIRAIWNSQLSNNE